MTGTTPFGIYLNATQDQVVRITSTYWIPPAPDWVYLTPEVNATLVSIRQLVKGKGLAAEPEKLAWGRIPLLDEDEGA